MSEGLNFWYGIVIFAIIAGVVGVAALFLGSAAIRLMVRDDYFEEPDRV